MQRAVDAFTAKIRSGMAALFYFSGYGMQAARQTYLIPINGQVWSEADLRRDGFSVDSLLSEMNRKGARVKIVIIDAARRNPFERRFRAAAAGLAAVDAPQGSLTMYSAAPGKLVPETSGGNNPFMGELVNQIRSPNLTAEEAFNRTRVGVSRASNNEQVPWVASSLVEEFYFGTTRQAGPSTVPAAPASPAPRASPPSASPAPPASPPSSPSAAPPPAAATRESLQKDYKAGDVFSDCDGCGEMVVVPAGSFDMGSSAEYENPPHRVTFAKPFAIGRYEVTFEQWDRCVEEKGSMMPLIASGAAATAPSLMSVGTTLRLSPCGFHRRPDKPIGSRPKPSGSMPHVPERPPHIGGDARSVHAKETAENAIRVPASKLHRPVLTKRTRSAFTMSPATRPNGWRTAGTTIIAARRRTARHGLPASAGCTSCAVARMTARQRRCVPPHAFATIAM